MAERLAAQDEQSSSVQLRAKALTDLRLAVEGLGRVTFPVSADQAGQLCGLGRPARFGRGEETLTDPAIRDTWEVPTELVRVEFTGGQGLDPELEAVREELGLPEGCRLTAELHSLLVYGQGQFFLPHQDSEKDDAMIATLVVTLPSAHTGGELVVHHLGAATTYRGWEDRISLVAFYADCRHEVRPVTSGHRITLTYNLSLHGEPADLVLEQDTLGELAGDLGEHFTSRVRHPYRDSTGEPPARLAFLLDHEYTARSLGWSRLKGSDASRAALLRAAADVAGCEAVLALTEIQETWDALEPDSHYGYGRSDQGWDDEDAQDDQDAGDDEPAYELNDLLDSAIRLTRWTDPAGTSAQDISLLLSEAEVSAVTPSSELRPYESQFEGYMGNYGNTLDRWYRRAAVVVWPRERAFANRAEASPGWAMDTLGGLARGGDTDSARAAADSLAPFWDHAVRGQEQPGQLLAAALPAAAALNDAGAAARLLGPFAVESLTAGHMAPLAELAGRYGERWTDDLWDSWFANRTAWTVGGLSRLQWVASLPDLCDALLAEGGPGESAARRLPELAWNAVATQIDSAVGSQSAVMRRQQFAELAPALAAVIAAAATTRAADLDDRIVEHCRQHAAAMTACVIAALRVAAAFPVEAWRADAFRQLATDQASRLRARLARPARAGDDWSVELPDGCRCELCGTLRTFLADPGRRTLEWPLAKDSRSHVHSRIDLAELPVSHQTRRQGRPFTLVLTKTALVFEREAQQRSRDQDDLDWLLGHWISQRSDAPVSSA